MNVIKTICGSSYGSDLWKFNCKIFKNYCKTWNAALRKLLKLLYAIHHCLLGLLIRQQHIQLQFYILNFKLLWYASRMNNTIIKTCCDKWISGFK